MGRLTNQAQEAGRDSAPYVAPGRHTAGPCPCALTPVGDSSALRMDSELSSDSFVTQFRFRPYAGVSVWLIGSGKSIPSSICGGKLAMPPDSPKTKIGKIFGFWGSSDHKCRLLIGMLNDLELFSCYICTVFLNGGKG